MTGFYPKCYKKTKDMRAFLMSSSASFLEKQISTPIPNKEKKAAKWQPKKISENTSS